MPDLVALDLPAGPVFVAALQRVWADGDAGWPVDQRLPPPARALQFRALRPAASIGADGVRRLLHDPEPISVDLDDALVVSTSGTTGQPKAAVFTYAALAAHAAAVHARLGVDPGRDRWLACLPVAHVGGLGVVTRALITGTPLVALPSFDAAAVGALAAERPGTALVSLVRTALDRVSPEPFRWVVLGGAADPGAQRPANVVATYGLTESGGGVVYDGFALDGTEVRIIDDEVQLRGPTLLRCYRDGTTPVGPDGWMATGDLGALGADGQLTVHGRQNDLIITGGENVWPEAVEAVLARHPAVADVAVDGRHDHQWGQRVVAFVVPEDASRPPTLHALRAWVKDSLPAYAAPRQVVLVDRIPRTALGKVQRSVLA